MIYLKISLSDFLTLFSARTRTWFWERRPGYALGLACIFATGSSTILSLFWDDIVKTSDAQMSGLRSSKYACVCVWIYCVLWFFLQDISKVACYALLEYIFKDRALEAQVARGHISAMIDADRKTARLRGTGGTEISFATDSRGATSGSTPAQGEVANRLASLEKEMAELKSLLKSIVGTAPKQQ